MTSILGATIAATAMAAILIMPASAQRTRTGKNSMQIVSSANMERIPPKVGLSRQDRKFLMDAAIVNMAEIELGQLAQRNGGTWARGYGRDMEREHGLALAALKKVARQRRVTLPTGIDAKHRTLYARLSRLRGANFDAAYREAMIGGHRQVLTKLQTEIRSGRDSSARNYAVMLEPGVKMHLKMAQQRMTMTNHDH